MGIKNIINLNHKHKNGALNLITDVPGVKVGHSTIKDGNIQTGVTAIIPHEGNVFKEKVMAGAEVINGFGKSIGILQVKELGTIETPIILTNTLSIGTAFTALCKYMLEQNEDIGVSTGTVNCLVTECNDGELNDIRGLHITEDNIYDALENADVDFEEGAVGGGTGMYCLGVKGGIGSASKVINIDGKDYTVGSLVMSNFGAEKELIIDGKHYDTPGLINERKKEPKDKGSIIMIIATDIPLSERQLNRVCKRATISLGRTGSFCGNGSGDIAIAFTTANKLNHYSESNILEYKMFYDENIDIVFEAAVEAIEEAIISSLYHADTTVGVRNTKAVGLREFLEI